MLTDDGYRQLMKHAKRLAQDGHGELAQHLRDAIDLRAEVEALKLQGAAAELVHRETATTVLVQMAEVEALRADAERWRYINTRNNVWRRHNTAGEEHSALCVILPYGADLSCRATREIAIDAARAAQGGKT